MKQTLEQQMAKIMAEYMEDVEKGTDEAAEATAKVAVARLKKTSPKGKSRKHYRTGWKVKRNRRMMYTVHNAKKPGLTHLLNNGHVKANQYGEYGRVQGDNHIGEAADWSADIFVKGVVQKL